MKNLKENKFKLLEIKSRKVVVRGWGLGEFSSRELKERVKTFHSSMSAF